MAVPKRRNAEQLRRAHETFRTPHERAFAEAYRRQMILLRSASVQEDVPFDADRWAKKVAEAMRPAYRAIMRASGRRYLRDLAPFINNEKAAWMRTKQLRRRPSAVIVALTDEFTENLAESVFTTWSALSEVVETAEADGLSSSAIDILLGDEWEQITGSRTEAIAISAVTGSFNGIADYLGRELVELNDWINAADARVRVTHLIYGGSGPQPTGFNYANLSGGSYTLRFPADPRCTELAEVVNCRCFLVPSATSEPSGVRFDEAAQQFEL